MSSNGRNLRNDANHLVGQRLRVHRETKGLTLRQVSEKVGKSVPSLSKIENGAQSIDVATFFEILRAIDTSPCLLMVDVELSSSQSTLRRKMLEEMRKLAKALDGE